MSFRLSEESLARLQEKRKQWELEGKIKTHFIDKSKAAATERAKKNKYGNVETVKHGISFSSSREAKRYEDLYLMEKACEIQDLKRQVPFDLIVNGIKVCTYVSDFCYQQKGKLIVNDAKGMKTSVYSIKKKLMKACLGIEILET
jgi:hypothetical protein